MTVTIALTNQINERAAPDAVSSPALGPSCRVFQLRTGTCKQHECGSELPAGENRNLTHSWAEICRLNWQGVSAMLVKSKPETVLNTDTIFRFSFRLQ